MSAARASALMYMASDAILRVDASFQDTSKKLDADSKKLRPNLIDLMVRKRIDELIDEENGVKLQLNVQGFFTCERGREIEVAAQKKIEDDLSDDKFLKSLRSRVKKERDKAGLPPLPRKPAKRQTKNATTKPEAAKKRKRKKPTPKEEEEREKKKARIADAATRLAV